MVRVILLSLVLLFLSFVSADESEIKELVRLLGDEEWRVRVAAEAALLRHNCDAYEALKEALESDDEETRYRAEFLLKRIGHLGREDVERMVSGCPAFCSYSPSPRHWGRRGVWTGEYLYEEMLDRRCRHAIRYFIENIERKSKARPRLTIETPETVEEQPFVTLRIVNDGNDGWISMRFRLLLRITRRRYGQNCWKVFWEEGKDAVSSGSFPLLYLRNRDTCDDVAYDLGVNEVVEDHG